MTVCVGVAVNDCIVFAADSASSLVTTNVTTGASEILNVYGHGDKVFNLFKGHPVCAMTAGMGNIGQASIAALAKELRRRFVHDDKWKLDPKNYSIAEITDTARKFLFEERFSALDPAPAAPHSFSFWIGGYGSDFSHGHEVRRIDIVNGSCAEPAEVIATGGLGLFWGGQPQAISRLVLGTDPELEPVLHGGGMEAATAEMIANHLRSNLELPMVFPTMPVGDAIDLADFLVETTKRFVRFLPGADTVGGPTDIAVVTKYEGFKWIKRKYFYPASLNPLETDHA